MARRKITIEEAFDVLEQNGIEVQVTPKEQLPVPKKKPLKFENLYGPTTMEEKPGKFVKINLFARHSIGCGGITVEGVDGKQVVEAGVEAYGPGVGIEVPREYVAQLLQQDQAAKRADEDMLSPIQKVRIVAQVRNVLGSIVNVAIPVNNDFFDGGILNIPANMMMQIH